MGAGSVSIYLDGMCLKRFWRIRDEKEAGLVICVVFGYFYGV